MSNSIETRITEVLRVQFPKSTKFQRDYATRCVVAALGLTEEVMQTRHARAHDSGVDEFQRRFVTSWERTEDQQPAPQPLGKCTMLATCDRDAVTTILTGHQACQQHLDEFKAYVEAGERTE